MDETTPEVEKRMTTSCTDKMTELKQLESDLPPFLDPAEKAEAASYLRAINHNTAKSMNLMTEGGSKRLLHKLRTRLHDNEEKLKQLRELLRVKYDEVDQRAALDLLVRGITASVHDQTEEIGDYLEEHAGEGTVSQVDSFEQRPDSSDPQIPTHGEQQPEPKGNNPHDDERPGNEPGNTHPPQGLAAKGAKQRTLQAPSKDDEQELEMRLQRLQSWNTATRGPQLSPLLEYSDYLYPQQLGPDLREQRRYFNDTTRGGNFGLNGYLETERVSGRARFDHKEHRGDDDAQGRLGRKEYPEENSTAGAKTEHSTQGQVATQVIQQLADCMSRISARSELPPPPVETFDGNCSEYPFFIRNFLDRVGSGPFSDSTKLSHLIAATQGAVKAEMLDFKGQADGYERALKYLRDNYGRPQRVVSSVIADLTQKKDLGASNGKALRDFARKLETSYSLLQEYKMTAEANTQTNLKAIFDRLPHWMKIRWVAVASELESKDMSVDFKAMVDFIGKEVKRSYHPVFELSPGTSKAPHDSARDRQRPNLRPPNNQGFRQDSWNQPPQPRPPWNPVARGYTHAVNAPVYDYLAPEPSYVWPPRDGTYWSSEGAYQIETPPSGRGRGYRTGPPSKTFQPPGAGGNVSCKFCNRLHKFIDCPLFAASDAATKKKFVHVNKLCFICLGEHLSFACKKEPRTCPLAGCSEEHRLLHGVIQARKEQSSGVVNAAQGSEVLLRILPVKVKGVEGKSLTTFAMLDGGSTCSFLDAALSKELGIAGRSDRLELSTISTEKSYDVKVAECDVAPVNIDGEAIHLDHVNVMDDFKIAYQASRDYLDFEQWPHLRGLPLRSKVDRPIVGLLIGEKYKSAHRILEERYGEDRANEPYAARTKLGWYAAGPVPSSSEQTHQISAYVVKQQHYPQTSARCCDPSSATKDLERTVRMLWNEERHGFESSSRAISVEDRLDLERLKTTTYRNDDGHYTVGMLWKGVPDLPNNYVVARSCLEHVVRRMKDKPLFRQKYAEAIEGYVRDGHAVKLSDQEAWTSTSKTWYLPHHGVQKVHKPNKVRVVFNAASRYKGHALNDELSHGPDLNNCLAGTLIRFRKGPVAVNADIMSMFHMVYVSEEDSDALRFLWYEGENKTPSVFKMKKHIFGAKDSPTVCVHALQQCARDHAHLFDAVVGDTVLDSFYMDDMLAAAATEESAITLSRQVIEMLQCGGFKLEKFVSNKPDVLKALPQDRVAPACVELNLDTDFENLPSQRALGMRWDVPADTFSTKFAEMEKPETRRGILSFCASVIDPLGRFSPVVLVGRLIMQDTCRQSLAWDEPLPDSLLKRWRTWRDGLPSLRAIAIARCYRGYENPSLMVTVQLHHFCDASENAYGVASYLRVELATEQVVCTLVFAKSRCKPLRHLSTPRLETQAAVIAVRCHNFLKEELKMTIHDSVFWTDSTIVLQYVRNTSKRFKSFVANRMEEIHDHTSASMWRHCPTRMNPADIASRGVQAQKLKEHPLWFQGPEFLRQPPSTWPVDPTTGAVASDDPEVLRDMNASTETTTPLIYEFLSYYSTWEDLVRHMCTLIKFVRFLRGERDFKASHTRPEWNQSVECIVRCTPVNAPG